MRQLLEAGVHFGHRTDQWNPRARHFIYAEHNGTHLIDLVQTQILMERACDFMRLSAAGGKRILFVGTKRAATDIIESEARRCGVYFINRRWLGGMMTNFEVIRTRIMRLRELDEMQRTGELFLQSKRDQAKLNRELYKLERAFGGVKNLDGLPEILFVVDITRESLAIREAARVGCAVVAMVDTNSDPTQISFPIPSNDDSIRSVKLVTQYIADAIAGQQPPSDSDGPDLQPAPVPKRPVPFAGLLEIALMSPTTDDDHGLIDAGRNCLRSYRVTDEWR